MVPSWCYLALVNTSHAFFQGRTNPIATGRVELFVRLSLINALLTGDGKKLINRTTPAWRTWGYCLPDPYH